MKRWMWNSYKTQNFLKLLKDDGMISTQISTGQIIVSICNYKTYQKGGLKFSTQISTEVDTGSDTLSDTGSDTRLVQREQLKTIKTINNNLKKESDFSF
jgi:hypothetical protein